MIDLTYDMLPPGGEPDTIPINASGLKISACPRRWYFEVYRGLRQKDEDPILTVGKIVHKFAEDIAFDRSEENLSRRMLEALKTAAEKKLPKQETDQVKAAIAACPADRLAKPITLPKVQGAEYKFTFPIEWAPGFAYVGTIDRILHDTRQNIIIIEDIKTSRKYLFKDVIAGYEGDTQFTFYPWIVNRFAYSIFEGNIDIGNLAWYRNLGMRCLAVMLSNKPVVWREGPVRTFTETHFLTFEKMLKAFVAEVREYIRNKEIPPPRGMTCNACPTCPFKAICFAQQPAHLDLALSNFNVVKYEPLKW